MAKKITVLGCGSWAMAIAQLLAESSHDVCVWAYKDSVADDINHHKQRQSLPGIELNASIRATTDLTTALADSVAIIVCMPSIYLASLMEIWKPIFNKNTPVCCLTKGIASDETLLLSDVFEKVFPEIKFALLSGPNLAAEIAAGKPAASVVASQFNAVTQLFQTLLSSPRFRVYTSSDLIGVACGGVLKNIMAIAAGAIDALGLGLNTKALLVSRGLAEMMSFGCALGAKKDTFFGLSGLGDLVATCHSPLSRNYQLGLELGSGKTLEQIQEESHSIAEGVRSTHYVHAYASKHHISMPITATVKNVLDNNQTIEKAIHELMTRTLKDE